MFDNCLHRLYLQSLKNFMIQFIFLISKRLEWRVSRNFAKCKKCFCEKIFAKNECKLSRKLFSQILTHFWPNSALQKVQIGGVIDLLHVILTLGVVFVIEIQIGNQYQYIVQKQGNVQYLFQELFSDSRQTSSIKN